jgi:hypothetical protein
MVVIGSVDSCSNEHLAAALFVADPVLHRVFDQRLKEQRRQPNVAESRRDVHGHPQPMLEPRPFDVEIRLDDLELARAS